MDLRELEEAGVRMIRTRDLRGFDEGTGNAQPVEDWDRRVRIEKHYERIQRELASVESN